MCLGFPLVYKMPGSLGSPLFWVLLAICGGGSGGVWLVIC